MAGWESRLTSANRQVGIRMALQAPVDEIDST